MFKFRYFAAMAAIVMAQFVTVSAFAQDVPELNDANYKMATFAKMGHRDYVSATQRVYDENDVLVDSTTVILESAPNHGIEVGVFVGGDMFNKDFSPIGGAEIGYHGCNFSFFGRIGFGMGEYNEKSSRAGQAYFTTDFIGQLGVRLFDLPSKYKHQNEVWLIGSFGYKLRQNYNIISDDNVQEEGFYEVKGSTMAYGAGIRINFKRWMKRSNWYVQAMCYTGNEYFLQGSQARVGASLTVGYNFVLGKKTVNKKDYYAVYRAVMNNNQYMYQSTTQTRKDLIKAGVVNTK